MIIDNRNILNRKEFQKMAIQRKFFIIIFIASTVLSMTFLSLAFGSDLQTLNHENEIQYEKLKRMATNEGSVKIIVKLWVPDIDELSNESKKYQVIQPGEEFPWEGILADVVLKDQISLAVDTVRDELAGTPYRINHTYSTIPYLALDVSSESLAILESLPQILDIEEDVPIGLILPIEDNSTGSNGNSNLSNPDPPALNNTVSLVGADIAWSMGYTGSDWYVAILDTGIRRTHEFFEGKAIVEACFAQGETGSGDCPNGNTIMTGTGSAAHYSSAYEGWDHGTHVSGIATGNNGSLYGIAKDANIIAVQVFSRFADCDSGTPGDQPCVMSWSSDQLAGLDYIYSIRGSYSISSVNMSLGGGAYSSPCDTDSRKTAIDNLRSVGIATEISTGNSYYCSYIGKPACISTSIAVGSSTDADVQSSFSNWHATMQKLFAPGSSIYSSTGSSDTSYASWSGTSMAAPHVTGAWALLKQAKPTGTVDELLSALQSTGVGITSSCDGHSTPIPRIQVDAAINVLSGAFTVLSPNGGESWDLASTEEITWTTASVSSPLIIQLYQGESFVGKIAQDVDPSTGSYTWTIGQLVSGTAPVGMNYRVRIIEKASGTYDRSDGTFELISSSPSLTVTVPNGGENWDIGSTQQITWTSTGLSNSLTIQLYQNETFIGKIAQNVGSGQDGYLWTVGELTTGAAPGGTGYIIRIIEKASGTYDRSDGTFELISSGPSLTVTVPNGGENWDIGSTQQITWTSTGLSNSLTIQLYQNGTFVGKITQDVDPNEGSFMWTVGELISGEVSAGSGYEIRIIDKATSTFDNSNGTFTLTDI
jgi:subtilisin family serine protease